MSDINNINLTKKRCKILPYVAVFIVTLLIYIAVLMREKAYPFGTACFLHEDAYVQYNTMIRTLIEYVHSGDLSSIMWDHGMGIDIYLNMLYYLLSPFNVIALILGSKYVELSLVIIIILKCSIIPVSALYFFRHTTIVGNTDSLQGWMARLVEMSCAMAYGLCGYVIAYGQNMIWLDAIILMPLIAIAIERLISGLGWRMYVVLLALVMMVNFYYSIYVCMFAVIYLILASTGGIKRLFRNAVKTLIFSIVSAVIAACVLLPALLCIMKAGDSYVGLEQIGLSQWGNLPGYVVSFFPFKQVDSAGYLFNNNNYIGTIAILMVIAYMCNRRYVWMCRVKYAIVVFLLMLGANWLPLNYVLHGFTITHGIGNRFSIILMFVMVAMAYMQIMGLENIRLRDSIITGIIAIALLAVSVTDKEKLQVAVCYAAYMIISVVVIIVLVLLARKSITGRVSVGILSVLWCMELIVNAVYVMPATANDEGMTDSIALSSWEDAYNSLENDDDSRKTALIYYNYTPDSEVNWYSSMINGYSVNAFASMGLAHYDNVEYVYDGTTPLTALMYNVRYVLTNAQNSNGGYHMITQNDVYSVYEADDLAGMGFMADSSLAQWKGEGTVAENQSDFISLGFGEEVPEAKSERLMSALPWCSVKMKVSEQMGILTCYSVPYETYIWESYNNGEFEKTGIGQYIYKGMTVYPPNVHLNFVADSDMELYTYSMDTRDQVVMTFADNNSNSETAYYNTSQLVYGGHIQHGQQVKVAAFGGASMGETAEKKVQLYTWNSELFDKVKPYILDETLISDGYSGNTFCGHITAKKDGVLYLAFPYSDGYTVYVDGQKAEKLLLGKGNMGVELTEGYHDIKLEYRTPGLMSGAAVSLAGIVMFILICVMTKRRNMSDSVMVKNS